MPRALYGAFGVTLDRIRDQKPDISKQAIDVLQWVFLSQKPLTIEQLRHALAVEPDDTDLDWDNFVDSQLLLSCCLGLVIVDESTSTVRLVHKSLQDYFRILYDKGTIFIDGHHRIAHICLTYMSFDSYDKEVLTMGDQIVEKYVLLKYATSCWDYHSCSSKTTQETEDMVFYLLHEKFESRLFFRMLLSMSSWHDAAKARTFRHPLEHTMERARTKSSLVHVAVSSGMVGLLHRTLAFSEADINIVDWYDESTPMIIAAEMETPYAEQMLEILLKTGNADINLRDSLGYQPLHIAARKGNLVAVKLLLENGAEVNSGSHGNRRRALHIAATHGDVEIARLLLEKGADVNVKVGGYGYTPLLLAVQEGSIGVLKVLLEHGVDINAKGYDMTALVCAAQHEQWEIVRMLLQEDDIDINLKSTDGKTLLSSVIENGEMEVLEILLERDDVEIDSKEDDGSTPLLLAAYHARKDMVERLLEKGADANTQDKLGRTPLMRSILSNSSTPDNEIMKLLLAQPNIDVNLKDEKGNSALSLAMDRGFSEFEEILRVHGAA
jgi:ankyrin repeat protein